MKKRREEKLIFFLRKRKGRSEDNENKYRQEKR